MYSTSLGIIWSIPKGLIVEDRFAGKGTLMKLWQKNRGKICEEAAQTPHNRRLSWNGRISSSQSPAP